MMDSSRHHNAPFEHLVWNKPLRLTMFNWTAGPEKLISAVAKYDEHRHHQLRPFEHLFNRRAADGEGIDDMTPCDHDRNQCPVHRSRTILVFWSEIVCLKISESDNRSYIVICQLPAIHKVHLSVRLYLIFPTSAHVYGLLSRNPISSKHLTLSQSRVLHPFFRNGGIACRTVSSLVSLNLHNGDQRTRDWC
jgi:hypothetical protein